jgi:hypothetical protein
MEGRRRPRPQPLDLIRKCLGQNRCVVITIDMYRDSENSKWAAVLRMAALVSYEVSTKRERERER